VKKLVGLICIGCLLFVLAGCATSQKAVQQDRQTLDSALDDLVDQIVLSLSQNQKSKIAVIEFSDIQGNITNLGKYLAEELTTRLYLTGNFEVVERQLLNKVIEEQQLGLTGYIDDNTAVSLGQILGIDAIASGSITDLGKNVKVNARLISAESGKVFSVASVKIPKDETICMLLGQTYTSKNFTESKKQTPKNPIVEKEGLKFELVEATMSERTIIFKIKITNTTEDDIRFGMIIGWPSQYTTKIYDNNGNEYGISSVKIGNKFKNLKNSVTTYDGAETKIIAGISVNMEFHFDKVSSQTTVVSLLQINCGQKMGMLEFRNIQIKKI
jgi:TolB-like protein